MLMLLEQVNTIHTHKFTDVDSRKWQIIVIMYQGGKDSFLVWAELYKDRGKLEGEGPKSLLFRGLYIYFVLAVISGVTVLV